MEERLVAVEGVGAVGTLSVSDLAAWSAMIERIVRRALPAPAWDAAAAVLAGPGYQVDTAEHALSRYVYLRHVQMVHQAACERAEAEAVRTKVEVAGDLLTRRPALLRLESGRLVQVTGRSLGAILRILSHDARVKLLNAEMEHIAGRIVEISAAAAGSPRARRRGLLRRATRYQSIHERACTELLAHRREMLRHVFTSTGAPAVDADPGPAWLDEITAADEQGIALALLEVGAMRYSRLGPPPPRPSGGGGEPPEDFGIASALGAWGIRTGVRPAELVDVDLGVVFAEIRTAPRPSLEEVKE